MKKLNLPNKPEAPTGVVSSDLVRLLVVEIKESPVHYGVIAVCLVIFIVGVIVIWRMPERRTRQIKDRTPTPTHTENSNVSAHYHPPE